MDEQVVFVDKSENSNEIELEIDEELTSIKSNAITDQPEEVRNLISENKPTTSKLKSEIYNGNKIVLTQLNGVGYCFSADDYMKIRKDHRISGSFMGVNHLKGYTRKNQMLPIEFNEYEIQLMLDEKIAILVSKKESFKKSADSETEEELLKQFEKRILEQEKALNEKKIEETIKNISKVMTGKRKKLLQSGVPEKEIKITEKQVIEEMKSNIKFDRKNAQLEISNNCIYDHEGKIVDNFRVEDQLGYRIFRDIWKRGNVYVTLGGNFGGNFLIYPGDPLAYHASHVVHVLTKPEIHPLNLIAKCRLTVNVNKICILAYIDNTKDEIRYQTVHWEGSKDKQYLSNTKDNTIEQHNFDTDEDSDDS